LGNGEDIRFSVDVWLGGTMLAQQYPTLYNILQTKHVRVSTVLAYNQLNIAFRSVFNNYKWNQWINLCQRLMMVQLTNTPNKFVWKLNDSGIFSVRSMYLDLMNGHTPF
jgi:hypothetical protein